MCEAWLGSGHSRNRIAVLLSWSGHPSKECSLAQSRVLSLRTGDIWGQVILCGVEGEGHPVHRGIVSPPVRLLVARLPAVTTKNVPWGPELALVETPWIRGSHLPLPPGDTVFSSHLVCWGPRMLHTFKYVN